MQIFLPYKSPLETAKCLDKRRLNKQIIECHQIMRAINGETKAWQNHPICKMYSNHLSFVSAYTETLEAYKNNSPKIEAINEKALSLLPSFITDEYCDVMKRRLYTKDKNYYSQFAEYGECEYNLYFVDGEWRKYVNGVRKQ